MLKLGYQGSSGRNRRRRKKSITMSKTSEFGSAIDSEHLSELTEEELEQSFAEGRTHLKGGQSFFVYLHLSIFPIYYRLPVLGLQVLPTFLHPQVHPAGA